MRARYRLTHALTRALARLLTGWRVGGTEHLPPRGPYIVAGNHISLLDPPLLGAALPQEAAFFAKAELFRNPLFAALIRSYNAIPVRRGSADREAIERALAALRAGRVLAIFPEGTRDRRARIRPAKSGVGLFAVQTGLPVVPALVTGTNRFLRALVRRPRVTITFGPAILPPPDAPGDPAARRAAYDAVGQAWYESVVALAAAHERGPR